MSRELSQNNSKLLFLFIIFVSMLPVVLVTHTYSKKKNLGNSEGNEESEIYYSFIAQR